VDVYTENKRVICPIETKEFGSVILVAVGATMVGSINFEDNTDEGAVIKKFQSHGFFAFGGSTVLLLFEPGRVMLDSDILANSRRKLETLIKVRCIFTDLWVNLSYCNRCSGTGGSANWRSGHGQLLS